MLCQCSAWISFKIKWNLSKLYKKMIGKILQGNIKLNVFYRKQIISFLKTSSSSYTFMNLKLEIKLLFQGIIWISLQFKFFRVHKVSWRKFLLTLLNISKCLIGLWVFISSQRKRFGNNQSVLNQDKVLCIDIKKIMLVSKFSG